MPIGARSPRRSTQGLLLSQAARRLLGLNGDGDTSVVVCEHTCTEPGCPPLERRSWIPGGHFYLVPQRPQVVAAVGRTLQEALISEDS